MNVISLLPHLVHNYESLTPGCRDAADHIAQVRYYNKNSPPSDIGNLSRRRTFEWIEWTKEQKKEDI